MRGIGVATTLAVCLASAPLWAQQPRPLPRLGLITLAYDTNGRVFATRSTSLSEDFTVYTYARSGGCDLAQGREGVIPTDAGYGWRVEGRFVSRSPTQVVVHLEWQRAWEANAPVSGPKGALDLDLHPNERVTLDAVTLALPGRCDGAVIRLQVGFEQNSVTTAGGGGRGGGFGGVGAGPVTGGTGGGGGGGRVVEAEALMSQAAERLQQLRSGSVAVTSGFAPQTLQAIDVEVWLVHRRPGTAEVSQHVLVRTLANGGGYTFATIKVPTAKGDVDVDISGIVQARRLPTGEEDLFVSIIRRHTIAGGAPADVTRGGTGRTIPMPKPGDVVSFEMPASPQPEAMAGHQFSLRVSVNRQRIPF